MVHHKIKDDNESNTEHLLNRIKGFMSPAQNSLPITLILLMWRIWWAPNNASRWQMWFNSAFKGVMTECHIKPKVVISVCHSFARWGQQVLSDSCETTLKSAWSRDLANNCCPYSWEKLLDDILYKYESRLKQTCISRWSKCIHYHSTRTEFL